MLEGQSSTAPCRAAFAMFAVEAVRIGWIAHLPEWRMVQRIPDDAFYYLVLAKNFAQHGRWTFDGTAPASGFHLLWGYVLAFLSLVGHSLSFRIVFIITAFLLTGAITAATFWITGSVEKLYGPNAAWGACLALFSCITLMQATMLMEAPLVIFFAAACLGQLVLADEDRWTGSPWLAFALGMLGTFARSDFGILTFFLLATAGVARRLGQPNTRARLAALQFAGASTGLLAVFAHTYAVDQHLFQANAEVKLWWAQLAGLPTSKAQRVVEDLVDPFYNYDNGLQAGILDAVGHQNATYIFAAALVGGFFVWKRGKRDFAQILLPAMVAVVAFYIIFLPI